MAPKDITILTTTDELTAFCDRAANVPYITIDTEFIRERTYYSKLCLIQISSGAEAVIVDPLAAGIDLKPLYSLLDNPKVLKVFHAARQDIEIFYHQNGTIPHPVFDTQVAAMVCGFGESISYEGLVQQLAHEQLDKSSRFTNWEQRPLTKKQLDYALDDVIHLRTVYEALEAKLEKSKRIGWIGEEMEVLINPETYDSPPEDAWIRLRVRTRSAKFLAVLQAAAAWRERTAIALNIPRGRLLKDDVLSNLAAAAPRNKGDLLRMRGMNKGLSDSQMDALLEEINIALEKPKSEWPKVPENKAPSAAAEAAIELLRVLLKRQCGKEHVAQKLVANREDLEQIAAGKLAETPAGHGWRFEIFGRFAADLLAGKLALALNLEENSVILLTSDDIAPEN